MIEVREAPGKGRGVFATRDIRAGELICSDPVVAFSDYDLALIKETDLERHWWHWDGGAAIAFGPSSMVNDARDGRPNARNLALHGPLLMQVVAIRDIAAGEEVLLDYAELDS